MTKLVERVRRLEGEAQRVDLETMSDDELIRYARDHWREPPWGSDESVAAMVTMVLRTPSRLPIVARHPDFRSKSDSADT